MQGKVKLVIIRAILCIFETVLNIWRQKMDLKKISNFKVISILSGNLGSVLIYLSLYCAKVDYNAKNSPPWASLVHALQIVDPPMLLHFWDERPQQQQHNTPQQGETKISWSFNLSANQQKHQIHVFGFPTNLYEKEKHSHFHRFILLLNWELSCLLCIYAYYAYSVNFFWHFCLLGSEVAVPPTWDETLET